MKVVFFGFSKVSFEYETIVELREEAKKYNITIGEGVTIGSHVTIEGGVTIGTNVTIGDDVTIGEGVTIGNHAKIEGSVTIGDDVTILTRAKIKTGITIRQIIHVCNAYKYHASAYYFEGVLFVQLGCFTRTKEEWEADFWNNDEEFPKGSEQGQKRIEAFRKICKMAELL
jgi:NDP-sugar pyrophosphorylase family protein